MLDTSARDLIPSSVILQHLKFIVCTPNRAFIPIFVISVISVIFLHPLKFIVCASDIGLLSHHQLSSYNNLNL